MVKGAENMTHIFIINPYAGKQDFAVDLRKQLEQLTGVEFYIFNTRYAGYEEEIVKESVELFPGEKLRFYCCGGSGTMRNMLNGLTEFEDVEFAMYPKGSYNDFLDVFEGGAKCFQNIEDLIHGEVVWLDYIKTNHGICLNNLSVGVDTYVMKQIKNFREMYFFGRKFPYMISVVSSMFASAARDLTITIDGERMDGRFMEVIFGNGSVFGGNFHFSGSPDVCDGKGDYCLDGGTSGFSLLPVFGPLVREDMDQLEKKTDCGQWKRVQIVSKDGEPITVNQDGVMVEGYAAWNAEIVPGGLPFVVPKGVKTAAG